MIADYFIVERRLESEEQAIDSTNWAGVASIVLAFGISFGLQLAGIFPLGFLLALVLTLTLYPVLRMWVLKPGMLTKTVSVEQAKQEEAAS